MTQIEIYGNRIIIKNPKKVSQIHARKRKLTLVKKDLILIQITEAYIKDGPNKVTETWIPYKDYLKQTQL